MRALVFFLLLFVVCFVVVADDSLNNAYKLARETLDPDNEIVDNEVQYRMEQLSRCKLYECESHGDPSLTKLSDAEIQWFKTIHKAVITLRHTYPKQTGSVWCAVYSVLQTPEICQMHHASELIASLTFLVQKDLATDELVSALNKKKAKDPVENKLKEVPSSEYKRGYFVTDHTPRYDPGCLEASEKRIKRGHGHNCLQLMIAPMQRWIETGDPEDQEYPYLADKKAPETKPPPPWTPAPYVSDQEDDLEPVDLDEDQFFP